MNQNRNRNTTFKISITSLVKLLILNMLNTKPYYGNQIMNNIKITLNNFYSPSPGMIYPLLRKLEEEGYILGWWTEPDKKSTRYYRITDDGQDYLKVIKKNYKNLIDDSIKMLENIKDKVY